LVEQYNLIDISGSDSAYFFFCLRLAFILFALKFLEVSLLTIYQGFKRYDVAAGWSVASRLIILIANVVSVTLFYGLDGILFCTLIIQLIYILILAFSIKLSYHFLSFTPRFVFREAKEFLTFGLWTWAQNMMAVFTTQVDKLIVVSTAGLQFHSIFFSVSSWVFPIISEKTAKREALGKLYCDSQALLQLFGLGILVILLLLEREILTLWLGSSVYEKSSEYIRVFVYYNFFLLLMILPNFFLNGSSNVKQNTLSEFVLKVLNILFMVSFYYLFGTIGLVWGLVISTAIVVPLKIAQVEKYVLFEKTEFLNIKSIVSATMLILSFQIDQFFGKITFGLLFLVFFYLVFLRKISVQSWLSKILEFKKVLNN
jgi:O-antigen/teichoic acid export membrane protein